MLKNLDYEWATDSSPKPFKFHRIFYYQTLCSLDTNGVFKIPGKTYPVDVRPLRLVLTVKLPHAACSEVSGY
jgi:hypothetical protein